MYLRAIFLFLVFIISHGYAEAAVNIQHWKTPEGARVYFVENHDLPILDISVGFPAGSVRDTAEKSGLAGITRYMMALGAGGMDEEAITNQFADIGALLGGSFDVDQAAYKLRTLTAEQDKAIALFNTILHKPDFPEKVLEREKARIIASLKESDTEPEAISEKAFKKALYGQHPYALDGGGEVETVKTITPADLQSFYQTYYTSSSAVIALIGNINETRARQIADAISKGLPAGPEVPAIAKVSLPQEANNQTIPHPATQAHLLIGQPGMRRGDPDFFPLYVGNYILGGGGFVSRLTEEVREKRGLAYSVYSYFMPTAELGPFQIGLQTKKEQAPEALAVVRGTLKRFLEKGVTEKELQAAKNNIIGGFPMRVDSNRKILEYLAMIGFYQLPLNYLETFNERVAAVSSKQILDAFNRRLQPDKFVTIVVGP